LVAAFQSTLTEAREATLLLHVIDASDPRRDEHIAQVNEVLAEIGADSIPQIIVYNKIDRLQRPAAIERDEAGAPSAVWISAEKGLGIDLLTSAVAERLSRFARRARVRLAAGAGALRSRLYAAKAVREERTTEDGSIDLTVELPDIEIMALARTAGVQILEASQADIPCASPDAYLESRMA
jgi:GTP-binding protein HflX